jgi:hypothetical protein
MLCGELLLAELIRGFSEREFNKSLGQASYAFKEFMNLERRLLKDKASSFAEMPFLKATLGIQSVDHETLFVAVQQIQELSQCALTLLLSSDGRLLADAGVPSLDGGDYKTYPGIVAAIDGQASIQVWRYRGFAYLVAVSPILLGDRKIGILSLGTPIDARTAETIQGITGTDVLLVHEGDVMGEAIRSPGAAQSDERETRKVLASLPERMAGVRRTHCHVLARRSRH